MNFTKEVLAVFLILSTLLVRESKTAVIINGDLLHCNETEKQAIMAAAIDPFATEESVNAVIKQQSSCTAVTACWIPDTTYQLTQYAFEINPLPNLRGGCDSSINHNSPISIFELEYFRKLMKEVSSINLIIEGNRHNYDHRIDSHVPTIHRIPLEKLEHRAIYDNSFWGSNHVMKLSGGCSLTTERAFKALENKCSKGPGLNMSWVMSACRFKDNKVVIGRIIEREIEAHKNGKLVYWRFTKGKDSCRNVLGEVSRNAFSFGQSPLAGIFNDPTACSLCIKMDTESEAGKSGVFYSIEMDKFERHELMNKGLLSDAYPVMNFSNGLYGWGETFHARIGIGPEQNGTNPTKDIENCENFIEPLLTRGLSSNL